MYSDFIKNGIENPGAEILETTNGTNRDGTNILKTI
jgi:hypothetical protein